MFSRSIGVLACALVATNGFLIPPSLDDSIAESLFDVNTISVDTKNQIVELPCSSCAFSRGSNVEDVAEVDNTLWIQGGANNLLLNFTISRDGRVLELNGVHEYPPRMIGPSSTPRRLLHLDQIAASTSREQLIAGEYRAVPLEATSHGISTSESETTAAGEMLVGLKWRLLEVENQPVEVDEVGIQLLKLKTGELLILSVEVLHNRPIEDPLAVIPVHRPSPHSPAHDCGSLPAPVCRFLRIIQDKADAAKHSKVGKLAGCAGRKGGRPHRLPGHIKPHFDKDGRPHGPPFRHGPPRGMHPHGLHGHHGHHHGPHHAHHQFLMSFVSGFMAILTPVLTGLAIGLLYCGMFYLASRFIVWFWIRVVHRGKAPTSERTKRVLTALGYNEAKWFPVDEEAQPPVYEEPPVYELSEKNEQEAPLLSDVAMPQL
ncbi:hypothetical protein B0A48_17944 [Cryoendolithus antarcticus]|uniref:DUF7728 domain-containing protein n=1 Tax=Cryoendolithus antarcticus TaxID=1507870 RepID=A0A1V8S927_9PEZI|nr:hypothetical protein B0A48_17944 [Cryoendolithus antarcticus]